LSHWKLDQLAVTNTPFSDIEISKLNSFTLSGIENINWHEIAAAIGGRTALQCFREYTKSKLNEAAKEETIIPTEREIELLKMALDYYGQDYKSIALMMGGWSQSMVKKYCNTYEMELKVARNKNQRKGNWNLKEDLILMQGVKEHGNKWSKIATELPGRSGIQCYTRFHRKLLQEDLILQNLTDKEISILKQLALDLIHTPWEEIDWVEVSKQLPGKHMTLIQKSLQHFYTKIV
jgi:hypothetical protein